MAQKRDKKMVTKIEKKWKQILEPRVPIFAVHESEEKDKVELTRIDFIGLTEDGELQELTFDSDMGFDTVRDDANLIGFHRGPASQYEDLEVAFVRE